MQFPPILAIIEIKYFFLPLYILNIDYTKDYKMHPFILFCLHVLT
jgi:hypothetical protein